MSNFWFYWSSYLLQMLFTMVIGIACTQIVDSLPSSCFLLPPSKYTSCIKRSLRSPLKRKILAESNAKCNDGSPAGWGFCVTFSSLNKLFLVFIEITVQWISILTSVYTNLLPKILLALYFFSVLVFLSRWIRQTEDPISFPPTTPTSSQTIISGLLF